MNNKLSVFFLYTFVFVFIYSPPFSILPINISILLSVFCVFLFFDNNLNKYFSIFKVEILLLMLICIYVLFVSIRSGFIEFYDSFIILFFNIPVVFFICYLMDRIYSDEIELYDKFISVLMRIAIIASIISIFFWLNKDVGEFVKFEILKYSKDLLVYQSHRGFGLSDELFFSYSIVQSCIFLLVLERSGINFKTVVFSALVISSIALNARIGLVFLSFFVFIPKVWRVNSFGWMLVGIMFLSILFLLDLSIVGFIQEQILYFFEDATGVSDVSSTNILFTEMFFLPKEGWQVFFGDGSNVFYSTESNSDSGYIIMLFYGGLAYLFLTMTFFLYCFTRGLKLNKIVPITILIVMVLIASIKGLFFAAKPGMHLFIGVYTVMIFSHYRAQLKKFRSDF